MRATSLCAYVHVDDILFASGGLPSTPNPRARLAMEATAEELEAIGFLVNDRRSGADVVKAVGYEPRASPAALLIPAKKAAQTYDSLKLLTARIRVHVDTLRSVIGVWVWEGLLTRDVLSIAHNIFNFMTRFEGRTVTWWPSARQEANAIADFLIYVECDLGAPLPPMLFATDAQGANNIDDGGFGIVAAVAPIAIMESCLMTGALPRKTVVKLDGDIGKLLGHTKRFEANIPFTPLPKAVFDGTLEWHTVLSGRWNFSDRIELGEARATLRLLRLLATFSGAHRTRLISLEDNSAFGGASAKGRSPAPALNYILRQMTAVCRLCRFIVILPWVQSAVQPADEASRLAGSSP